MIFKPKITESATLPTWQHHTTSNARQSAREVRPTATADQRRKAIPKIRKIRDRASWLPNLRRAELVKLEGYATDSDVEVGPAHIQKCHRQPAARGSQFPLWLCSLTGTVV